MLYCPISFRARTRPPLGSVACGAVRPSAPKPFGAARWPTRDRGAGIITKRGRRPGSRARLTDFRRLRAHGAPPCVPLGRTPDNPRGESARAGGGAAVVLEQLVDRGGGGGTPLPRWQGPQGRPPPWRRTGRRRSARRRRRGGMPAALGAPAGTRGPPTVRRQPRESAHAVVDDGRVLPVVSWGARITRARRPTALLSPVPCLAREAPRPRVVVDDDHAGAVGGGGRAGAARLWAPTTT